MTKIEFVYGEAMSGKTTEIKKYLKEPFFNPDVKIGIVFPSVHQKNHFNREFGIGNLKQKGYRNVKLMTRGEEAFGQHFDIVYIDDSDMLDYNAWLFFLRDSMCAKGGKIVLYMRPPKKNFSVRMLTRKGKNK